MYMGIFIREHGSILYLGMAKEFLFTVGMVMAQEASKPQTKHPDSMTLPNISPYCHHLSFLLCHSLAWNQLLSYFMCKATLLSPYIVELRVLSALFANWE